MNSWHVYNFQNKNFTLASSKACTLLRRTQRASRMAAEGELSSPRQRQLFSIAPMMDWTDVHYRVLARLLTRHTVLWTEMVVDKTIIHSAQPDKYLWFPAEQSPLVLQIGGSDPSTLAAAAKQAVTMYPYDEVNLNCGCPSDRVAGAGCFGASLMLDPVLVGRCMHAIAEAIHPVPVSVKCRLGVDEADSYAQLSTFIKVVSETSPVEHFIIHARTCLLNGLSPAENRSIPPLRHLWVWALKRDFPHLRFTLNGGLLGAADAAAAIPAMPADSPVGCEIEGVMVGRGAYNDPWNALADVDRSIYGAESNPATSRREVLRAYAEYADATLGRWSVKEDGHRDPSLRTLIRPILNLFHGEPRNKKWKTAIDAALLKQRDSASAADILNATMHFIPDEVLDAPPRKVGETLVSTWSLEGGWPSPQDRAGLKHKRKETDAAASSKSPASSMKVVTGASAAASTAEQGTIVHDENGTHHPQKVAVVEVQGSCMAIQGAVATEDMAFKFGSPNLNYDQSTTAQLIEA